MPPNVYLRIFPFANLNLYVCINNTVESQRTTKMMLKRTLVLSKTNIFQITTKIESDKEVDRKGKKHYLPDKRQQSYSISPRFSEFLIKFHFSVKLYTFPTLQITIVINWANKTESNHREMGRPKNKTKPNRYKVSCIIYSNAFFKYF